MHRFISVCLFVCWGLLASSQQQVRFDHLSINDGLSQSTVNVFLQDSRGFMWMGTQDGLNRYDGYEFVVFHHDPVASNTIADNYIHDMLEDTAGRIWLATDNGLSCFNPANQQFKNYYLPNADNTIRSVYIDEQQKIWAGFASAGIWQLDEESEKFNKLPIKIGSKRITDIFRDDAGTVWVATEGGGVNRIKGKDVTVFSAGPDKNSIAGDIVWKVFQDSKKRLWFGTNKGLSCLQPNSKAPLFKNILHEQGNPNTLSGNVVKAIAEDAKGAIWVGIDGQGLNQITFKENTLKNPKIVYHQSDPYIATSLSNEVILSIFQDNAGLLWVGTNNGVNRLDPQKQSFSHYRSTPNDVNTLSDKNVWSVLEDEYGILWVGTREGLNRIDKKTGKNTIYKNISSSQKFRNNKSVMSLFIDWQGEMWLGTAEGLYKVILSPDRYPLRFEQVSIPSQNLNKEIENRVYVIAQTSNNVIWAGMRYGLLRFNKKTGSKQYLQHDPEDKNTLSDNTIRSVIRQSNGVIWVGTEGGLDKVVTHNDTIVKFIHYHHQADKKNSLSNNMVMTIAEAPAGVFWLGTYGGGLNRFHTKTNKFKKFTEKDGLTNNAIYGILQDESGRLWLSTNKGLSVFNPKTKEFYNYYENDGLQSNEFNIGAYYKAKDGRMYFGGINGLTAFYPKEVSKNEHPPIIVLTNFKLFNDQVEPGENSVLKKHISLTKEIVLDFKQDNFTIEYAALHYANPNGNRYAYKMEGFDKEWVKAGTSRSAHYTSLEPGEYVFKVKGCNSDGIWSDKVAELKVTILPPFWQTWWFRILVILLGLGSVYGVYRTRVSIIKQQKRALEVLVQKRTEEVIKQKEKIQEQNKALTEEKDKVEKLLSNILPEEALEELKTRGKTKARNYRKVTVMFVDIVGFTRISEDLRPNQLIAKLDSLFSAFDKIIGKYNIEKIKTMGDAYMCAAGVPIRNRSNPLDMILAAMEIQQYMAGLKEKAKKKGEKPWQVRIGIHTGELTAGVIGLRRFSYDIWGDTVNVAKRMESTGAAGKINVSWKTYNFVKDYFDFMHRGTVTAKNKGEVDAYFVKRIKPHLSVERKGFKPNDMFWEYVNLELYSSINYRKAEKYIVRLLKKGLADDLYYHSLGHMRDVCHAAEEIAHAEGVKGEDLFLLKTAAIFHDAGFIKQYMDNEPIAAEMAREVLPRFGYSEKQLDVIEGLILATAVPQKPNNHLQQIICDADLDYLGRTDFHKIADNLRREFLAYNIIENDKQWDEIQIKFLTSHTFFTKSAKAKRSEMKQKHLKEIKERYERDEYGVS